MRPEKIFQPNAQENTEAAAEHHLDGFGEFEHDIKNPINSFAKMGPALDGLAPALEITIPNDIKSLFDEAQFYGEQALEMLQNPKALKNGNGSFSVRFNDFLTEFKKPLEKLLEISDSLAKADCPEELKGYMDSFRSAASQIRDIMNDPLTILEIKKGDYEGNFKEENIKELTENSLNIFDSDINKKNIRLRFEFNVSGVSVDKKSFDLLLMNLLKNAIEASPEGGEIIISASQTENQSVELCVQNEGEIPEDVRMSFWEKNVTRGKESGTGLGTYIIQMVAQFHGGSARFETGEGKTNIYINLPNAQKSPATAKKTD